MNRLGSIGFARLSAASAASPAVTGVVLMVMASAFLATMHGSVRFVSGDLHPFVIAFFRNVFGFCVLLPWLLSIGLTAFSTNRI